MKQPELKCAYAYRCAEMLEEEFFDVKELARKYNENFNFISQGVFQESEDEKGELCEWWTTQDRIDRINALYERKKADNKTKGPHTIRELDMLEQTA